MMSIGKSGESSILDSIFKEAEGDILKTKILPQVQKIRIPKAKSSVRLNSRYFDERGNEFEAVEILIPKIQLKRGFYNGTKFAIYLNKDSDIIVEERETGSETFANDDHGIKEAINSIKEKIINLVEQAQSS